MGFRSRRKANHSTDNTKSISEPQGGRRSRSSRRTVMTVATAALLLGSMAAARRRRSTDLEPVEPT